MTTKAQKLAPLPDPPEGKPEDMTNFNQTNITGNAHNLMHHLGNFETTLAALVQPSTTPEIEGERRFTGLISAAKYTGQAVQAAKLKAWFAMLGVITLSMALINLYPSRPLRGFKS